MGNSYVGLDAHRSEDLPDSGIKLTLQRWPTEFRIAVYLADVEGFGYREVTDRMGTPIGTAMSRLHCGRLWMRRLLRDYPAAPDR